MTAVRDPRLDPAAGDLLACGDTTWRVIEAFVSVDFETGRHRGVCAELACNGEPRRECLSLVQFRKRLRDAHVKSKSLQPTDWTSVRHIAAPLVCAAMAAGHWPPVGFPTTQAA